MTSTFSQRPASALGQPKKRKLFVDDDEEDVDQEAEGRVPTTYTAEDFMKPIAEEVVEWVDEADSDISVQTPACHGEWEDTDDADDELGEDDDMADVYDARFYDDYEFLKSR